MKIGDTVRGVYRDATGTDHRRNGIVHSKPNCLGFFWVCFEDEAGSVLQMVHTMEASAPGDEIPHRAVVMAEVRSRIFAMAAVARIERLGG